MAVDPAAISITALSWVPPFARGHVRDLRAFAAQLAVFDREEMNDVR